MFKFIDNDTVAMVILGALGFAAIATKQTEIAYTVAGAIGGYIGSQVLHKAGTND